MYRIIFDTTHSKFVVQLMIFGMFWRTTRDNNKARYFDTYGDAVKWARDIGLDQAYHRQATQKDYFAQGIQGGGPWIGCESNSRSGTQALT